MSRRLRLYHYALGAVAAAFLFNLLLRVPLKVGGLPATLAAAVLVALGLRGAFAAIERRPPEHGERWVLLGLYSLALGLLYLLIWLLMWLKDEPGTMGQLLFVLHYLCYPAALALALHLPRGRR
ncbi:hypothetical protein AAFN46_18615 [Pseudomonas sp. CAU 1711]|uniref:hypothetical protein n=1 Tax=Pseudomonas sp. CAU 1711 TaxID=3140356 RepID=UPI003261365C